MSSTQIDIDIDFGIDIEIERERERDRDRETDRDRDRTETETETERQRQRQRENFLVDTSKKTSAAKRLSLLHCLVLLPLAEGEAFQYLQYNYIKLFIAVQDLPLAQQAKPGS